MFWRTAVDMKLSKNAPSRVHPPEIGVDRMWSALVQVVQDERQLAAGKDLRSVDADGWADVHV